MARDALDEAVRLFLKTAADIGTVEDVLEEVGYTLENGRWAGPGWVGIEHHTLSVAG
jgi:hypothetical protein